MSTPAADPSRHPFFTAPHRTFAALSWPVLLSLIAEPLTGLVDTAFVARLGAAELAALGVGTVLLSSVFWIFNFLGIGTKTEVANRFGAGDRKGASEVCGLALLMSLAFGIGFIVLGWWTAEWAASLMEPTPRVHELAVTYIVIRLAGAPAQVVTAAAFGALRGVQDMRTPMVVAIGVNVINVVLDPLLIFGAGPIPAFGVAGAAAATVAAQWLGALAVLAAVRRELGFPSRVTLADARMLLVVGYDLMLRTALLTTFLVLATRTANGLGTEAGAVHQAVRQAWLFTAFALDAFATTAQSLVGYFLGAGRRDDARRVCTIACSWGLGTGVALAVAMLALTPAAAWLLVPSETTSASEWLFLGPWVAAALAQPLNSLSFVTDGIHWGTSDYRYLRNAMFAATAVGAVGLLAVGDDPVRGLTLTWLVTAGWIAVRAVFGIARVWPGIGKSPLGRDGSLDK